jgi:predicted O-methyltransferase YrrM
MNGNAPADERLAKLHASVLSAIADDSDKVADALAEVTEFEPSYYEGGFGAYYLYLHYLTAVLQPKLVVELGTLSGVSAFAMFLALPKTARLVTVDIVSRERSALAGVADDRLEIITANSLDANLPSRANLQSIDLLFVDTDHSYEQASREVQLHFPLMSPTGIAAFDDIHLNPGMEQFWNELPYVKIDTGAAIHQSGFGIVAPT